ncbi:MAG: restriction endonuclease [Chryseobacterium sp.]|nr:MAG: restriction endonuclease [Chryseobacterium sp.]
MPKRTISVFEYDSLRLAKLSEDGLSQTELEALQRHCGDEGVPYYSLIHNGVKFCEQVGVIQVGKLTIEVLPKIDRGSKEQWKKILIDMLKRVGNIQMATSTEASLRLKNGNILELYLEAFLNQAELLLHHGLLKKYRKTEANATALKGKLLFQKHIATNIVHKERFYVKYTIFDTNHLLNQLIGKTLRLIKKVNTNPMLAGRIDGLLLSFEGLTELNVSEATFDKIVYNRKNESYRAAMTISRLLLLNYFPDINVGKDHVMAIMFDMNLLWERFVYQSLKKFMHNAQVEPQANKPYWKLAGKRTTNLKPDVIILKDGLKYVLDTKWKLPNGNKPGPGDLQQMYAYTKYFNSDHTILCYPGTQEDFIPGYFHQEHPEGTENYPCSVIRLKFDINAYPKQYFITHWQKDIAEKISGYCLPKAGKTVK